MSSLSAAGAGQMTADVPSAKYGAVMCPAGLAGLDTSFLRGPGDKRVTYHPLRADAISSRYLDLLSSETAGMTWPALAYL